MNVKSIFNLIELLREPKKLFINLTSSRTRCEQKEQDDFYCDAEKPFISMHDM